MPSRRQVAFIGSVAVAVAGAVVIWFGAAAIILAVYGHDVQAAAPWLALAKFASLAWAAAVGWMITWRRFDEMEKEARKLSWHRSHPADRADHAAVARERRGVPRRANG
jgi:membrane protein implicated in regulation of membrane protease activity